MPVRPRLPARAFVVVTWDDARSSAADVVDASTLDGHHRPYPVATAGWLMRDDAAGVSVCSECVDGDTYRGHTFVPRVLVRHVMTLRRERRRVGAA